MATTAYRHRAVEDDMTKTVPSRCKVIELVSADDRKRTGSSMSLFLAEELFPTPRITHMSTAHSP